MDSQHQNPAETPLDPRTSSFSQAQGYEKIPGPPTLGELPKEARIQIWNVFYLYIDLAKSPPGRDRFSQHIGFYKYIDNPWHDILRTAHCRHDNQPLDEWSDRFDHVTRFLRHRIETQPFNKVFDLIQFVMRHPECPSGFIKEMKQAFVDCRLSYVIDEAKPPTILPAATREESGALLESLRTLDEAGLDGASSHLRKASESINRGDWAGSVRESIHAVESVARTLAPDATTLAPALKAIEKNGALHPALKGAFGKLYGYASDKEGVRHALLNGDRANVGADEAIFMLGACASFASYLWRKSRENTGG